MSENLAVKGLRVLSYGIFDLHNSCTCIILTRVSLESIGVSLAASSLALRLTTVSLHKIYHLTWLQVIECAANACMINYFCNKSLHQSLLMVELMKTVTEI